MSAGITQFQDEEIERGLTALALCSGNTRRAAQLLEHDTTLSRVPEHTSLHNWKHQHADRYRAILEARAPQIEADAIHDYRAIVAATNRAHLQLVERTADGIDDLDAKDASAAAKNIAIAGGVAADKLLVFTDRPNVIHSHPDPMNTLTGLMTALGIPGTIPGTATELPAVPLLNEGQQDNVREDSAADSPQS
jgi:hypothetical protein